MAKELQRIFCKRNKSRVSTFWRYYLRIHPKTANHLNVWCELICENGRMGTNVNSKFKFWHRVWKMCLVVVQSIWKANIFEILIFYFTLQKRRFSRQIIIMRNGWIDWWVDWFETKRWFCHLAISQMKFPLDIRNLFTKN